MAGGGLAEIAGGEDAWYGGLQVGIHHDVAGRIEIQHIAHEGGVRLQTDEDEHAAGRMLLTLPVGGERDVFYRLGAFD